jgi:hypothetical protein
MVVSTLPMISSKKMNLISEAKEFPQEHSMSFWISHICLKGQQLDFWLFSFGFWGSLEVKRK